MNIKLHFPPEKPQRSCEALVFHYNVETGHIHTIINSNYSAVYGMFNAYDELGEEYYREHEKGTIEYNADIIAWAYMDEVTQGVFDEIHG